MQEQPGTIKESASVQEHKNQLYPIFLKLDQLETLVVGAGNVGLEKLQSLLSNSPEAKITVVAPDVKGEVKHLASRHPSCQILQRSFIDADLNNKDLVILATKNRKLHEYVKNLAKGKSIIVNVADTPDLCDFYLGSIVQKGSLKIAISTNGLSPTIAKRIKEVINDLIPKEMESVLENMTTIRQRLNGSFEKKVKQLDDLTKMLVSKQITLQDLNKPEQKRWQKIVIWCLFAFCFMIIGHTILSYIPFGKMIATVRTVPEFVNTKTFLMMLLTGFMAQMVDGSLGMGYGTISTTFLLAIGVNPAIVSSRVHSARVFSSGVSGYSHHRFGNINKKLFRALVVPGIIGAVVGASLAFFAQKYSSWVRLPLSIYTLYLGYFILRKAFGKTKYHQKVKRAGWLASAGGFMDSFAGGGWGTLVTSTLMSKRRSPRYVIGSVCLAEFFVVFVSSITFFVLLRSIPIVDVAGLILGGLIAAPIAARLVGKVPIKAMFIAVGALVILTSCTTFWNAIRQVLQ
ncbi:MAG TPA: TSUP family transporter [Chitinophagaceae bacterium]|nr:TSUP family transporter [Chitinophagaceae bacterium]